MTMNPADPLDVRVTPADQRRAADLTDACLDHDGPRVGDLLAELLDTGPEGTLAVTAVLARNLAAALAAAHGPDTAKLILANTRWDATLADDTPHKR